MQRPACRYVGVVSACSGRQAPHKANDQSREVEEGKAMGMPAVNINFSLVCQTCITCGIVFGVPADWDNHRQQKHDSFYCPNGHSQYYSGKSEAEKLREQLEQANRAICFARFTARMEAEQRRKAETKLDRINNGVCPKCKRSFKQLARHMQSKHGVKCNETPKEKLTRAEKNK